MKMTLRKNGLWSECEGILAKLVTAQVDQPDDVVSYQSLDSKSVLGSFEIVWTQITNEMKPDTRRSYNIWSECSINAQTKLIKIW